MPALPFNCRADDKIYLEQILPSLLDRRRTTINEYVYIKVPEHPNANVNGYVAEHRLILEYKIGRLMNKNEHAHHINGIKYDNRPENLELQDSKKHIGFHSSLRIHSEETKNKIKESLRNSWKEGKFNKRKQVDRSGSKNPMYGRKPTEKQLEGLKIGWELQRGRKHASN